MDLMDPHPMSFFNFCFYFNHFFADLLPSDFGCPHLESPPASWELASLSRGCRHEWCWSSGTIVLIEFGQASKREMICGFLLLSFSCCCCSRGCGCGCAVVVVVVVVVDGGCGCGCGNRCVVDVVVVIVVVVLLDFALFFRLLCSKIYRISAVFVCKLVSALSFSSPTRHLFYIYLSVLSIIFFLCRAYGRDPRPSGLRRTTISCFWRVEEATVYVC